MIVVIRVIVVIVVIAVCRIKLSHQSFIQKANDAYLEVNVSKTTTYAVNSTYLVTAVDTLLAGDCRNEEEQGHHREVRAAVL